MSRTIKFRAFCNNNLYIQEYCGGFSYFIHDESDALGLEEVFVSAERGECILQQFTGKTDERNKEIYEGDIVYLNHYDIPDVDKKCLFTIIFEDGAFKLNPIKLGQAPNGGVSVFTWMRYIEGEDSDGNTVYRYELPPPQPICGFSRMVVIENIFENEKLLK